MYIIFRVRLTKRRQKPGLSSGNTRLVVKHRPVNELEYQMQRYRERNLEPPGDEEEEEPPPMSTQEKVKITRTGDNAGDNGNPKIIICFLIFSINRKWERF